MAKEMTAEQFAEFLSSKQSEIQENVEKSLKLCCQKVRSDIQYDMAHTTRDTTRSYYTNNKTKAHHPSAAGNPPAPDTGNLRNSIRYETQNNGSIIYGVVGTTQKNPPYGRWLEYGTTKMAERPWLRPAVRKNNEFIRNTLSDAMKKTFGGNV